jgi:hypothetical protein
MVAGYSPLVPAVGTLTVNGVALIVAVTVAAMRLYRRGRRAA